MLCKYPTLLVHTFLADRSPSQFKASCLSGILSFNHFATHPPSRSRTTTPSTNSSLFLAGVAHSFGSPPSVILLEPRYAPSITSPISPSSFSRQLMNIGLLYTPVSIYQMTRGSLVLFVGVLSVLFLRRHLWLYQFRPLPSNPPSPIPLINPQMVFPLHCHHGRYSRRLQRFPRQGCCEQQLTYLP